MVIKCKMCGGDLIVKENSQVCECEFCGTKQTIPLLNNEKKANLFNRANRFRQNSEFDKAATIYASITAEFPYEAEAYWGLCLCKFGIEYVDDPLTGNKMPTCHRTLTTSILDDNDYLQALQNADAIARPVYEAEAEKIDELQQDILQIVRSESPYDVFICYKETDENGERTEDSVIAHEIYDSLTDKELKVFFARITLEDKLGQQYEPYIFAALQSARVMLVVGTSYENLDAVWVKNEWSRFLDMMRTDRTKKLIPCYKGIEIDELPKAFQRLQAQDLAKLGWIQDLTRGVEKICEKQNEKKKNIYKEKNIKENRYQDLLERAKIYLEDGLWDNAEGYCGRYINLVPDDAEAYWTMLLIKNKARDAAELLKQGKVISEDRYYLKAVQYANPDEKEEYQGIDDEIKRTLRKKYKVYLSDMKEKVDSAQSVTEFDAVLQETKKLYQFPEVKDFYSYCISKMEEYTKRRYVEAIKKANEEEYGEAVAILKEIGAYKDGESLLAKYSAEDKKQKTYLEAISLKERGHWRAAANTFRNLGNYRDAEKQNKVCARKAKQNENNTTGHKIASLFHVFINCFIILGIAAYYQKAYSFLLIIGLLEMIAIAIFTWRFDKYKSTMHVVFIMILAFMTFSIVITVVRQNHISAIGEFALAQLIVIASIFL